MQFNHKDTKLMACRRLALEQNQRIFHEANAINCSAGVLLDRPDLDCEIFDEYLRMRRKADALFREAIDHLKLLNQVFPQSVTFATVERTTVHEDEKETA
jgi:uncharacterized protein VirK/YbjX